MRDSQRFGFSGDGRRAGALAPVLRDNLYHDIALVILSSQIRGKIVNQNAICERFGINRSTLKHVLSNERFAEVYVKLRDDHYGGMAERILDAKADPIEREIAAWSETTALLGDTVAELRARIKGENGKRANSKDLSTAVDAYKAAYDRSPRGREGQRAGSLHLHATFIPSKEQALAMREAETECGVDMADVLDIRPVDDDAESATS